ncbi:MAG TPA: hypothetical protein VMZ90_01600, partial [Vicinamibacterales bacterium]|nr:hypothetical protein [Vicinamibacterales bacterium]
KALGLDKEIDAAEQQLTEERHRLQAYQQRREVKRLRRFAGGQELANRFARQDDYWAYCYSHESVHGSDIAWSYGRRRVADDVAGLHAKTSDPGTRASFAEFAASSVTAAAVAASRIFDWLKVESLTEPLTAIHALLSQSDSDSATRPTS